jgi:hypothetical protein
MKVKTAINWPLLEPASTSRRFCLLDLVGLLCRKVKILAFLVHDMKAYRKVEV